MQEEIVDLIGKSPISVPVFITGKIAFLACAVFFIVKIFAVDTMLYDSGFTQVFGASLYAVGLGTVILSILQLGRSTSVGIPDKETELKTGGIYGTSRNPIYFGAFVMCAGSCLFSIHLVNLLLFVTTIVVHVRIVKKEEEFLEKRFGRQWLEYKQRIPRYIGRIG